jgi:hypothetical protein
MRSNYETMTTLRDAVYAADKQQDAHDGTVEQALQDLRAYVGQHMNTRLSSDNGVYPPIQLKYTYDRLQQAEQARVDALNSQIYPNAQAYCEAKYPGSFSGGPRVPCISQYVKEHGTIAQKIPSAIYTFDFVTPRWSPDLAGWSLALAVLFFALAILRFFVGYLLKVLTR